MRQVLTGFGHGTRGAGSVAVMFLLAAIGGASCKSSPTVIDLTVEVEAALGLDAVQIKVKAQGKSDLLIDRPAAPSSVTSIVVSDLGGGTPVTLQATGLKGMKEVVIARGRVTLVSGKRTALTFVLAVDCRDVSLTCGVDETCQRGACFSIEVSRDAGIPDAASATSDALKDAQPSDGRDSAGTGGSPVAAGGAAGEGSGGRGGQSGASGGRSGEPASGGGPAGGAVGTGGAAGGVAGSAAATGGAAGSGLTCSSSQHICSGTCVANNSIDHCGNSCSPCQAPAGATATCSGMACDFTCGGPMKRCSGGTKCIPSSGCCTNSDCPAMPSGQTGTCDSGTAMCNYACPANTQACTSAATTTCIPVGGCCSNTDCAETCRVCSSATHTCMPVTSQDDPSGRCAGTCDAAGACKSKKGQACAATIGGCITGSTCASGFCCNQSCGNDATCAGTCAGRPDGTCQYPTTACGTAICSGPNFVDRGTCAQGSCSAPTPRPCAGGFVCSANACKTACTASSDCAATYYCTGAMCNAKKAAGQVCVVAEECTTASCSGRCCNAGVPCTCPQPSRGNLVVNPGFDSGLTGWTADPGVSATISTMEDADGCAFSRAALISNSGPDSSFSFWQCVPVSPGTDYNSGVRVASRGAFIHCDLDAFDRAGCVGTRTSVLDGLLWVNTAWSSGSPFPFQTASSTRSVRIACYSEPTESPASFFMDELYLSSVPGRF